MLHPTATPKKSYIESVLQDEEGVFIAVSDYMKMVADQITPWVPGGLLTLGTDGFGRSDTRENLRRFFEVDAEIAILNEADLNQEISPGKILKIPSQR